MLRSILAGVAVVFCLIPNRLVVAGPLEQAEVTKIINRVSVVDPQKGERPAAVQDVIKDDLGVETGKKSRSELLFQDDTLTRLGAETFFSFKTGTRDMTLEKGSMLLQVPKGLGGAKIHTAAVTAAITGTTIMMEYIPKQYIKVLVLEGSLRVSRNGVLGDSLVLRPGKMLIMRPDAKKIPEPVDVDLAHIVKTSSLVNFPDAEPLPSMALIQDAIDNQQEQVAKNNLAPTNLVMGHGTNVIVTPTNLLTTTTGSNLLGATLNGGLNLNLKGGSGLPLLGNTLSLGPTVASTTTTVNNLLTSTTGTVSTLSNSLTGAISSLPIVSSNQVLSLLDSTLQNTAGIVAVAPAAINSTVASVVTTPLTGVVSSNPTVSNAVTTVANTVGAVVNPISTNSLPAPGLSSVTSGPANLLAGTIAGQNSNASPLPLGLGLGH